LEDLASTVNMRFSHQRLLPDIPCLVHSERRRQSREVAYSSLWRSGRLRRRLPTRLRAISRLVEISDGLLTILDPGVSKSMDSLGLVLSNDHIPDRAAREQVEHSIGIRSLGLLVAAPLNTLISLHLTVEDLSWLDVHSLIEYNCFFGYRELQHGKREPW
jgi:hypothetical protein